MIEGANSTAAGRVARPDKGSFSGSETLKGLVPEVLLPDSAPSMACDFLGVGVGEESGLAGLKCLPPPAFDEKKEEVLRDAGHCKIRVQEVIID